jgi:glycosyltransferase involved in cell wall biosynthesis
MVSPRVSIIIPSYRQPKTVIATLESIRTQTFSNYEVIVVDSSNDATTEAIRSAGSSFPNFRLFESKTPRSPAVQRNIGIKESVGEWLAFVDTDVVLSSSWLEQMLSLGDSRGDKPFIAAGAIENGNPEAYWGWVLYWLEFSEFSPHVVSTEKRFLPSAALFLNRQLLTRGGLFQEIPLSEDVFTSRRWKDVAPLLWCPEIVCKHINRTSPMAVFRRCYSLGQGSSMMRKLLSPSERSIRTGYAAWPVYWAIRLYRISERILKSRDRGSLKQYICHLPSLVAGLMIWNVGFVFGRFLRRWPEGRE